MKLNQAGILIGVCLAQAPALLAQQPGNCSNLASLKIPGVEITKASPVPAGTPATTMFGMPGYTGPMPALCRVDGMINRRKAKDGEEFGIGFALALPDKWNGDFLMQGGGGANGFVAEPVGGAVAGEAPGIVRGFAVATTDTGHHSKGGPFDFSFMRDEQAALDFAYLANNQVAAVARQIIAGYYSKPAAYSYFVGCSTGGREGMILSQRYPTAFNGIVSGDPAMRTGLSNLAITQWAPAAWNRIAPRDASGKPIASQALTDADRKLVLNALMKRCDAKDGVADGMISDPLGCDFDPAELTCIAGKSDACLSPEKVTAIKKVFAGPTTSSGVQVYPGFPYDSGIAATAGLPGLLEGRAGPVGATPVSTEVDVDREALNDAQPLVDSISTNLTTFAGSGGKLIFYHGNSDPWFSPLDTLEYYKAMSQANGGPEKTAQWSRIYLVPGMSHCAGGPAALDQFDMLSAIVNWVEKGTAPDSVIAQGKAFPGRSRPLCAYPKHAQYKGAGDSEDAKNFVCQ